MKISRKQIDEFLLNLEKFIKKYHNYTEDIYGIGDTFILLFKANKDNRTFVAPDKRWLDIPLLTALSNAHKIWYIRRCDRNKVDKQFKHNRKSIFVQSVAYKLKYKVVKDVSYEHIFIKNLIKNSEKVETTELYWRHTFPNKLLEYDLKEFIVPEDYFTSDDLIIY